MYMSINPNRVNWDKMFRHCRNVFCIVSRPILQIIAHMKCLYPGFDGKISFKIQLYIDQVIHSSHYLMLRGFLVVEHFPSSVRSHRIVDLTPL